MKKILFPLLFFLELYALVIGGLNFYFRIKTYAPLQWGIAYVPFPADGKVLGLTGVLLLLISIPVVLRIKKELLPLICRRGALLLFLFLLPFLPVNFVTILAFIYLLVFVVYRIFSLFDINWLSGEKGGRYALTLAVCGGVAGALYGVWLQQVAYNCLVLPFSDWTVYTLAYRELGESLFSAPLRFFTIGGHFNLLPNMVGAVVFRFRPDIDTIFYLNSFIIYSTIPCAYFTGRSCGVPPWRALLFSLGLLLHFSLANLNTCVFYGYHPNIYLLPLFLLFYGFYVRKKYIPAVVFLILSLLVQETFAVFWFGFGFMLLVFEERRMKITGIVLMLLMIACFLLETRLCMLLDSGEKISQYKQMFHYSNLGGTVPEILLSPVVKPAVFFGELFAAENFYFAGMLFAGFFAAVFSAKLLVMVLPSLAGVFLLNGTDLANVCMQYQVEFAAVLIAAGMTGLSACGKISTSKVTAALAATIAGMFLCGFFTGQLPWGFYNCRVITGKFVDRKMQITELEKLIPPGKTLQTTLSFQAHFAGRNPLESFSGTAVSEKAEYLILPFSDLFVSKKDLRQIVLKLNKSAAWKCLAADPDPQYGVLVFVRTKR